VDPQLHEQIRRPEQLNGPEYSGAVEPLRRIRRAVPDIHMSTHSAGRRRSPFRARCRRSDYADATGQTRPVWCLEVYHHLVE